MYTCTDVHSVLICILSILWGHHKIQSYDSNSVRPFTRGCCVLCTFSTFLNEMTYTVDTANPLIPHVITVYIPTATTPTSVVSTTSSYTTTTTTQCKLWHAHACICLWPCPSDICSQHAFIYIYNEALYLRAQRQGLQVLYPIVWTVYTCCYAYNMICGLPHLPSLCMHGDVHRSPMVLGSVLGHGLTPKFYKQDQVRGRPEREIGTNTRWKKGTQAWCARWQSSSRYMCCVCVCVCLCIGGL